MESDTHEANTSSPNSNESSSSENSDDSGSLSMSDENADDERGQEIQEKNSTVTIQNMSLDERLSNQRKFKPKENKHVTIVTTKQKQDKPQYVPQVELVKSVYQQKKQKDEQKDVDEYDIYGELVARKLRNLKTHYARITVQNMLNMIIHEAELGKYDVPLSTSKFNMLYNSVIALPERSRSFASTSNYSDPLRVKSTLSNSRSVSTQHTPYSEPSYFDLSEPPL